MERDALRFHSDVSLALRVVFIETSLGKIKCCTRQEQTAWHEKWKRKRKRKREMKMRADDEVEQLTGEELSRFELAPSVVAQGREREREKVGK